MGLQTGSLGKSGISLGKSWMISVGKSGMVSPAKSGISPGKSGIMWESSG